MNVQLGRETGYKERNLWIDYWFLTPCQKYREERERSSSTAMHFYQQNKALRELKSFTSHGFSFAAL